MESKKNNHMKVIGIVAGILIVVGIGLAIGLLNNRAEPVEDSLADAQNEVMTSQEESVPSTQLPEITPETAIDTVEPEIDPALTGDSILKSGLSLREAWAFYNEAKKNNEELGLSAEENNEFLNNLLFDLGTTLEQLEYSEKAGVFNEQQQVAQNPSASRPTQQPSSKGGQDVDGDGKADIDVNGNVVKGGYYDQNNNGLLDGIEDSTITQEEWQGGTTTSDPDFYDNLEKNNPSTSSKGGTDVDGDGVIDYDANGNLIKGSSLDKNNNGLEDSWENDDSRVTQDDLKGGTTTSDPDFYDNLEKNNP